MIIVKHHQGYNMPISINLDIEDANVLYATLSLASQIDDLPQKNLELAVKLYEMIRDVTYNARFSK